MRMITTVTNLTPIHCTGDVSDTAVRYHGSRIS
jgi:hypothetical protein